MNRYTRSAHLTLLTFTLLFVQAAAVRADAVDDLVRAHMAERNIPGAAVAVIRKGRVVKQKGYGVASVEFGVPVTNETAFEVGSVSKQMTAAGIMLLVQDGKVRLDETISAYLQGTPASWAPVTVRHLLAHSSGIKSYTGLTGFELSRRMTRDQFIERLAEHELEFTPGERTIYSNSGYNLLAYIIQEQSGKPFMDFMRERIFRPLGMTKTTERDPQYIIPLRAVGYEWRSGRLAGRDGNLTNLMGAGSIVSTLSDMIKWEAALRGDTFLTPATKAESWKNYIYNSGEPSAYGLGWRVSDVRSHRLVGHTGQTAGFGAAIYRYTASDITVIVLTNLGEIGLPGPFAANIAKQFIPSLSLKTVKDSDDPDPDRGRLVSDILRRGLSHPANAEHFTESMNRSLRSTRAQATADRLARHGTVSTVRYVEEEKTADRTAYRYLASTQKRIFLWRVNFDDAGKINEIVLEEEE
ncbi:MAG: beta-lactamase family protein [Blastocatellia bacterium]|nr:beta-lactamase family protein [Blastocatellia bacterium]